MSRPLRLRSLRAFVFRHLLEKPVTTSFGAIRDRPMAFVRAEDDESVVGWGEIWCNFPTVGAEHRARLVESVLAPWPLGRAFDRSSEAFAWLTEGTAVLALQPQEPGPFAQAIAGVARSSATAVKHWWQIWD
jgi:D-galactarolactone cycloisomerase